MNFTETQYRRLLDLIYTGMVVVNGDQIPQKRIQEYEEIEQIIYAKAGEVGLDQLVKYSEEQERYYTTKDFDRTEIGDLLDHYHECIFWSGLAFHLAKRDALNALERKEIKHHDVVGMILEKESAYRKEFIENGLENLFCRVKRLDSKGSNVGGRSR